MGAPPPPGSPVVMKFLPPTLFLISLSLSATFASAQSDLKIVTVVGAGGTDEYAELFQKNAGIWKKAASKAHAEFEVIGLEDSEKEDAELLKDTIASVESPRFWLVLIGHGTFDGRSAKFNLRGPDITDDELASWLKDYPGRLSVINTASASGSLIQKLAGPDRVVITATKNESEVYFTQFGTFFTEAIPGLEEADLDNDEQVSLLEAFIHASRKVADYYEKDGRLATEHSLLDDNGDGIGSRAEWFEGTTPVKTAKEDVEPDGEIAAQRVLVLSDFERQLTPVQRQRRDELERKVKSLRRIKAELPEDRYYKDLETLLLELAQLYRSAETS